MRVTTGKYSLSNLLYLLYFLYGDQVDLVHMP